jgi:hypothetical protein
MSEQARAAIGFEAIEAVADRGYYSGEEIVACEQWPKRITHGMGTNGQTKPRPKGGASRRPDLLYLYHNPKLVAISQMAEYPQIGVRMDEEFLKLIDEWRRKLDDLPTRPEAIRRLCELGLKAKK